MLSSVNAEYTPGSPFLELPSVILQRCVAIPGNDDLDIAVSEAVSPLDVNFQQLSIKTPGLTRLPCCTCVTGSKASTVKYTIANFTQWYRNETTTSVFLAELEASVDGGTGRTTRAVVCKVVGAVPVNLKALRLEASLYRDKLEKLQGIHVAEFLGLFEGSAAGDQPYAILVTVFEGNTLNRELVEYDVDFRRRVLDALIAIHKAGTTHGDVVQHNIVRKDNGTPMFIDFDCGETPHECGYREGSIKFHAPMPMAGDVGCVELWMVAHEADVWTSSHYSYYSGQEEPGEIPVEEVLLGRKNIIKYQLAHGVDPKYVDDNADAVISALGNWIQRRTLFDGEVPLHQAP